MRNKGLIRATALILVLLLTGCGNKAANTGNTAESANSVLEESQSKEPENTTEENSSDTENDTDQTDSSLTEETVTDTVENSPSQEQTETQEEHEDDQSIQEAVTQEATEETKSIAKEEQLSNEQLNSFSMMYYLAITAEFWMIFILPCLMTLIPAPWMKSRRITSEIFAILSNHSEALPLRESGFSISIIRRRPLRSEALSPIRSLFCL